MANRLTQDELNGQLHRPGWRLVGEGSQNALNGTLGEVLTESHARKSAGGEPGRIEQIETEVELDLFQIEQLWQRLGLPVI